MIQPKTNEAQKIEEEERALQFRIRGLSYRRIAVGLECSHEWARQLCHRALERHQTINKHKAEELREIERARLDFLQDAHWTKAMQGDLGATAALLKIQDQRCRLEGIYQDPADADAESIAPGDTIIVKAMTVGGRLLRIGGPRPDDGGREKPDDNGQKPQREKESGNGNEPESEDGDWYGDLGS